jgi:hypothetical protein
MSAGGQGQIRLEFTGEQIDKWFKSMHEYKEEINRRYLESIQRNVSFTAMLSTKNERK